MYLELNWVRTHKELYESSFKSHSQSQIDLVNGVLFPYY